jgi:hypothetical protein
MLHVTATTHCMPQVHTVRADSILSNGDRCRHAAGAEQTTMHPAHLLHEVQHCFHNCQLSGSSVFVLATNMSQPRTLFSNAGAASPQPFSWRAVISGH